MPQPHPIPFELVAEHLWQIAVLATLCRSSQDGSSLVWQPVYIFYSKRGIPLGCIVDTLGSFSSARSLMRTPNEIFY